MDGIAAALALLAAAFFALAATLWQRAGLAAQGVGVALQGAALDRGRLATVQPLLVTSAIFAMPLGYFLTGQRITGRRAGCRRHRGRPRRLRGRRRPGRGRRQRADLGVARRLPRRRSGVSGAPALWHRGDTTLRAATYGIVAGMLFGVSATLMKPVVEAMHSDGWGVMTGWQLWALAATGIVGFLLQQISLATGRLVTSVASVSVANPIVSVTLGAVLLEERLARPTWHVVVAVGALAVALFGVIVITSAREGAAAPAVEVAPA